MKLPIKQEVTMLSSPFINTGALDPSALSRTSWTSDSMMMDEPMDFGKPMYGFDSYSNFDQNAMLLDSIVTNDPVMPNWTTNGDLDFTNFINGQGVA